MKGALIRVLFLLFATGVFGDTETVSVIEGDSVTLHTGVTEIQRDDVIEWKLNVSRIAKISGDVSITDGVFRDGLQLDNQTGDLKITNIKTTDSGEYILKIKNPGGSSEKTFSVIGVSVVDEVKSVLVIVGYSVTLNSGTNIQRDDVIKWRFVDLNSLIAENNRKTGNFSTSDGPDGRFRDRLYLDYTTGSLTVRNIGIKHSGFYEAGIRKSSSGHTIHKSYSVTASGEMKSALSVKEGESVTLNTDLTEIQTTDLMQWMFGDTVLTEINKARKRFSTSDGPDGRFRDRLKLDHQTGSLTITNTRNTDSGLYELKTISNSRFIINKRISVTVTDPPLSPGAVAAIVLGVLLLVCVAAAGVIYYRHKISEEKECYRHKISEEKARRDRKSIVAVMEGETLTLNPDQVDEEEYINPNPDYTEVHKDGTLQWMFRGSCIAERKSAAHSFTVNDDLKGRLELDPQTGSLTITDTRNADSGEYKLLITRSGKSSIKRFRVSVFLKSPEIKTVSVKEGGSVTLETDVTADIMEDGFTQWLLGYTPLAEIRGGTKTFTPFADVIFKDRLELDDKTVTLTIKKTRPTDAGIYMLYKIGTGNNINKLFRVELENKPEEESVRINNPEEMPLNSVP